MKTHQQIILLISLGVFIQSCAKLPVYQSKEYLHQENDNSSNMLATNFDKKTNINFGVANDDTYFYVETAIRNREDLMKIMRGGLVLYFDANGKKAKDFQLKIERSENQQRDFALLSANKDERPVNRQSLPSSINLNFNKVTWDKNGHEFVFYRNILKDPISVELIPVDQNELILKVKMPISEIPKNDQRLFSLGIASGSVTKGEMNNRSPQNGMRPSGGGGMGGHGGMQGGGMRGNGQMHSQNTIGPRQGGQSTSDFQPFQIWFKVQL